MIVELSHYLLCMAFVISILHCVTFFYQTKSHTIYDSQIVMQRYCSVIFGLLFLSFLGLTYAFLGSDFSVKLVITNSHTEKPLLYKISAVWGNHEGSILLWALIMSLYQLLFAKLAKSVDPKLKLYTLSIQSFLLCCFLGFLLFTSNPFERVFPPGPEGLGLNPILQDPGLAFHPPTLYMGYVGFSLIFSFLVAYLWIGQKDYAELTKIRSWSMIAWVFLTLGIGLGSWWAYYELGWGGWWFWDPVENASLMPWLIATAFIHSLAMTTKRKVFFNWTIWLGLMVFIFSLAGTFLVRSGLLTSVHAFASDPQRGLILLGILIVTFAIGIGFFLRRFKQFYQAEWIASLSRESLLFLQTIFFVSACLTVLIGTIYPYIVKYFTFEAISVGPGYFQATVVPLMLPAFILMMISIFLKWFQNKSDQVFSNLLKLSIILISALIIVFFVLHPSTSLAVIGMVLGVSIIISHLYKLYTQISAHSKKLEGKVDIPILSAITGQPKSFWGMMISHIAVGMLLISMTASMAYKKTYHDWIDVGGQISLHPYVFMLKDAEFLEVDNYKTLKAEIMVKKHGKIITTLFPEKRVYATRNVITTEAAIYSSLAQDIYITISSVKGKGSEDARFEVQIFFEPMMLWLWASIILIAFGALIAIMPSRK